MNRLRADIGDANNQLWRNQNLINTSLLVAEDQVVLMRRILNDALGGVTRIETIERPVSTTSEDIEQVQVIDWRWYDMQLQFSHNKEDFMRGVVVSNEDIDAQILVKQAKDRAAMIKQAAQVAARGSETALRRAVTEDSGLDELIIPHLKDGETWSPEATAEAPDIVWAVLKRLDEVRAKQAEQKRQQAEAEQQQKLDAEENADLLEEAQQELMAKTAQMAELAGDVKKAADAGDEEKVEQLLGEMETRVEAEEALSDFPEGATIFGG